MPNPKDQTPSCKLCCYWAPNMMSEAAQEGVCRKLAENPFYYGSLITEASDRCDKWIRLGVYQDANGQAKEERRVALRTRINLLAQLHTAAGNQSVWLADLSEYGAGISMSNPPMVGTPGILKWGSYDFSFTVAWANDDSCGVTFDASISSEIVLEAIRKGALKNDRSAEPSRIAHGHKRASLV